MVGLGPAVQYLPIEPESALSAGFGVHAAIRRRLPSAVPRRAHALLVLERLHEPLGQRPHLR
jgi:hypothetical protein